MARLQPTRDMGMYSPLHQKLHDRLHARQRQTDGPVSGRTRSRTKSNAISPAHRPTAMQSPTDLEIKPLPSHLAPTSSTFTLAHPTKRALDRADRRLRRTRLRLKRHLETSPEFRDEDGDIRESTHALLTQLPLTQTGSLLGLPEPEPGSWYSERRMQRKLMPRKRLSPLFFVRRNRSLRELDDELGVLPGEEWDEDGDADPDAEMEVEEMLTVEGRVMEELSDGYYAYGVWRDLVGDGLDGEHKEIGRWALREDGRRLGIVMDGRCIGIVRGVWAGWRRGVGFSAFEG